jgi:hypothetical protein
MVQMVKVRFFDRARKTVEGQWFSERMEMFKNEIAVGILIGAGMVLFLYFIHTYFTVVAW